MQSTYLITGATGFIGASLTHRLVKMKKKVHIISRGNKKSWRLKEIYKNINVHIIDLNDKDLHSLVKKINPDFVFHLSAYGSLSIEKDIKKMISTNVLGTANLITSLKSTTFKLFINTGSSSEYASKNSPLKETDPIGPTNDYALSKVTQTFYCQKEAIKYGLPIVTFRLFSPYGQYEDATRLVPHVILRTLMKSEIPLSSPGFVRDFIFVDDVVDAYLRACNSSFTPGEIFNVGSGKQHRIIDVVNTISRITKANSKPMWGKAQKQKRQIEPTFWEADISKAEKTLGWRASHDLESGLKKTIAWFRVNQKLYA